MSSVDNLLQQLEKRNAERVSSQGSSGHTQPQGDDQSCKQSVVVNGSPNILDNYRSEQLLRTIESVGNINSYEFLNQEKAQCLNYVKEGDVVTRITNANGTVDVQNADGTCDGMKQNQQISHSESNTNSSQSMSGAAKLQKQKAVDLSTKELADHLADLSTSSLSNGSKLSDEQSDTAIPPSLKHSDLVGEGHLETQSKVSAETVENETSEFIGNVENLSPEQSNSELVHSEDNKNNDRSLTEPVLSSQESLEEEEILQFTVPDEIPVVTGWKLDRRESGHLFWRRDSSTLNGVDPSSRVKFRYDVEVCEFESRGSETEDLLEEDEEGQENSATLNSEEQLQRKSSKDSSDDSLMTVEQPSSTYVRVLYLFAAFGVVLSLLYGWLRYMLSNEHIEKPQNS